MDGYIQGMWKREYMTNLDPLIQSHHTSEYIKFSYLLFYSRESFHRILHITDNRFYQLQANT